MLHPANILMIRAVFLNLSSPYDGREAPARQKTSGNHSGTCAKATETCPNHCLPRASGFKLELRGSKPAPRHNFQFTQCRNKRRTITELAAMGKSRSKIQVLIARGTCRSARQAFFARPCPALDKRRDQEIRRALPWYSFVDPNETPALSGSKCPLPHRTCRNPPVSEDQWSSSLRSNTRTAADGS